MPQTQASASTMHLIIGYPLALSLETGDSSVTKGYMWYLENTIKKGLKTIIFHSFNSATKRWKKIKNNWGES